MSGGKAARARGRRWQSASRDWWRQQRAVTDVLELGGAGAETTDYLLVTAGVMVSVEAKDHKAMALSGWVDQAVRQAPANCIPVVHHKRAGRADVGESYVTLRASDLARLIEEHRHG